MEHTLGNAEILKNIGVMDQSDRNMYNAFLTLIIKKNYRINRNEIPFHTH